MSDWFKKNMIVAVINALILIIITIISVSITRVVAAMDRKADKEYVDDQNDKQDKAIIETKTLFLFEITELRKDLRLKAEKK